MRRQPRAVYDARMQGAAQMRRPPLCWLAIQSEKDCAFFSGLLTLLVLEPEPGLVVRVTFFTVARCGSAASRASRKARRRAMLSRTACASASRCSLVDLP